MLPCKVLKLVKSRNVRSRIQHVFNKSVSVSSLLFIVVTSWKLWIFKLTHKEALSPFYPTLFKKIRTRKMLVFLKRAKNYLLSEKVLLLSGDNEFISDTAGTAEIPIVLTNSRRFMCS